MKRRKILVVISFLVLLVLLIVLGILLFPFLYLCYGVLFTKVEVCADVSQYNNFFGEYVLQEYDYKLGIDDSIFPDEITADMDVQDFKMVYYNPWDAEYLSYLVVTYDEAYKTELERLQDYESTDYLGIYGVEGFEEKYTLVAINADDYHGFVYALSDNEDTIVYVEMLFCNYYSYLDYTEYIPSEYLPIGFDAMDGNPYQKKQEQIRFKDI